MIQPFDPERRVLVVAEIGNNHEGNLRTALDLVRLAAEARADAVKFQTFRTELFVRRLDRERFDRLKGFELSPADFRRLADAAHEQGLLFLSTPLDLESARMLEPLVDAFKIASGDNTFFPLIDHVAGTGKPLVLSSGLLDLESIRRTIGRIDGVWAAQKITQRPVVLHCVTGYPVPIDQTNLGAIRAIASLDCIPGYSDHTIGIEAAALSAALGARVIEKHFTFDKTRTGFRDHQLSADPADLAELVQRVRRTEALLGTGEKVLQPVERELAQAVRRSIAAAIDLPSGTVIASHHLTWLRPGSGIAPGEEARLLGRALARDVAAGELLSLDDLR